MKLSLILFVLFVCIPIVVITACSPPPHIDPKKRQQGIENKCEPLYKAVSNGMIDVVKKIIKEKSHKNKLGCIKYALKQANSYGGKTQFQSYRYLVEILIAMKLPEQQSILTKLLRSNAIYNLSIAPKYTEYLLSVGALPNSPDEYGRLPVANALFAVNDVGNCKTPLLLINASSPKILANQNKDGVTALMQAIINTSVCSDEFKLLAKKSSGLNLVDQDGNTALHYVLMKMKRDIDPVRQKQPYKVDLEVLHILLKRGASTKIPNKKSITPAQLLRELKNKGCKC